MANAVDATHAALAQQGFDQVAAAEDGADASVFFDLASRNRPERLAVEGAEARVGGEAMSAEVTTPA